ncbi:MAG: putative glycoside hydrolase [Nitriliruptoraceae bacterium]
MRESNVDGRKGDAAGTDDGAAVAAPAQLHPDMYIDVIDYPAVHGSQLRVAGTTTPDTIVRITARPQASVATPTFGSSVRTDDTGRFDIAVTVPAARHFELTIAALTNNGRTVETRQLPAIASRVTHDGYRGVHVSFCGWAAANLREPVIELARDGLINAVQIDLKDEAGHVGYDSDIELAGASGAISAPCVIDLEDVVKQLHAMDVAVIGRIVAFADPVIASWAWEHDHQDMVVQTPDGEPYVGQYDGFSNPANPEVAAYNIDVAVEAAAAGVDHILWDYVRRPEGNLDGMRFPGLTTTPEQMIVTFVEQADAALAPYGIMHGASVYGIAATRPHQIGQDIPAMAKHLDYVAPMLYPTHWGAGEFGITNPTRSPYETIYASLATFTDVTADTRARVIPWLEDSTYRAWDRQFQVEEQLRATMDRDINEWLLWDPQVRYSREAIENASSNN